MRESEETMFSGGVSPNICLRGGDEMTFYCQQCGECCSHMGQIFTTVGESGDHEYLMRNRYTGEVHTVKLDPESECLFERGSVMDIMPEACFFLRRDPALGMFVCTVHRSRPELCREFGCWRILILDGNGRRAGRIMGSRHLAAEEERLSKLWTSLSMDVQGLDDAAWERRICTFLEEAGYRVVFA